MSRKTHEIRGASNARTYVYLAPRPMLFINALLCSHRAGFSVLHLLDLLPQDVLRLFTHFSELSTIIYVIIKLGVSSPVTTVAKPQPGPLI